MAAFLGRTEIGIRKTGVNAAVPRNPKAKLMYYLKSITSVLETESSYELRRLTDYENYQRLSESEVDKLVLLCYLVSPDELLDKCIFQDEDLCGDSSNEFYELSAVRNRLVVTNSILIGGQRRQVRKIMACKPSWIRNYWIEPMEYFEARLRRVTAPRRREPDCVIS